MSKWATVSILLVSGSVMAGAMIWMVQDSAEQGVVKEADEADGIARQVKVQDHLRAERLASGWAELDANGDQRVSEEEYGGGDETWLARFRRRDKNADGVVSAKESRTQERRERKNAVLSVEGLDKNGDGLVDLDEFPGPPDAFWRTDVDGDFYLSAAELETNNKRYATQLERLKDGGVDASGTRPRSDGKDGGRGGLTWQREKKAGGKSTGGGRVPPTTEIENMVHQCFADSRERSADHHGLVKIKVTIAGNQISKVKVLKNETGDDVVSSCLAAVVSGALMPEVTDRAFAWTFTMKEKS